MTYHRSHGALLLPLLLACACPPKKAVKVDASTPKKAATVLKDTVAVVGPRRISTGEIAALINKMSLPMRRRYRSDKQLREAFIDKLVNDALLVREARRVGLDRDPGIRRKLDYLLARAMERRLLAQISETGVTEQAVADYHEKHKDEFLVPFMMRARHILLSTKAEAEKVLAIVRKAKLAAARTPPSEHRQDVYFEKLAKRYSKDASTRLHGGDLGSFSNPTARVPAPLYLSLLSLKPGQLYKKPVKSPMGWHVLELTARSEKRYKTLAEVKQTIRRKLGRAVLREQLAKQIEALRKAPDVRVLADRYDALPIDISKRRKKTTRPQVLRPGKK